ncbi:hypothetical protein P43SY_009774 [Pythium insidiosum]|uniref:Ion transport domain-containing protein n=1 Tax=Pythium insidiosum TaxID=114742 RepID=A0AAD5LMY6_PYTIN|nr:hypothetical protein P43SY_009774 [Pythium insidiosum]
MTPVVAAESQDSVAPVTPAAENPSARVDSVAGVKRRSVSTPSRLSSIRTSRVSIRKSATAFRVSFRDAILRSRSSSLELLTLEVQSAFDPNSWRIQTWHQVLLVALLYELFVLPFLATFKATRDSWMSPEFIVLYGCEVLFAVDVYVELNTGYYEDGNVTLDAAKSRAKYLRSKRFILDALALAPWSLLLRPANLAIAPVFLEFNKFLRVARLPRYVAALEDVYARYYVLLKMFKVFLVILILSHYFGNKVMNQRAIKARYLRSADFVQDILALTPLYVVGWGLGRRLELLNANKLLRLVKVPKHLAALENNQLMVVKDEYVYKLGDEGSDMFFVFTGAEPPSDIMALRLLRALFFGTTAFVKKGKTFNPILTSHYVFTIVASFVGLLVMAFMIGEIASKDMSAWTFLWSTLLCLVVLFVFAYVIRHIHNRDYKQMELNQPFIADGESRDVAALKDAQQGVQRCAQCGFSNFIRVAYCSVCGSPLGDDKTKRKKLKRRENEFRRNLLGLLAPENYEFACD